MLLIEIVEGREEAVGVLLLIHIVRQHQRIATEDAVVEIVFVGALAAAVGESFGHIEVQQTRIQVVAVVYSTFACIFSPQRKQRARRYTENYFFLLKGRIHEKPKGFSQSHSAKKVAQPLCVRAFRLL